MENENEGWGDEMTKRKERGMLRIYFQNVNSLGVLRNGYETDNMCVELKGRKVDMMCLAETNVNWRRGDVKETMRQKVMTIWDHGWVQGSSSEEKMKSEFKPGGTVTVLGGKWVGAKKESGGDKYGRWSWISLTGGNNKEVVVITG